MAAGQAPADQRRGDVDARHVEEPRGRGTWESLLEAFGELPRVEFFDMPRIDISSSDIRRRVAAGAGIRYLVPDPVAERIEQKRLYR